jgi:hypothetical protein
MRRQTNPSLPTNEARGGVSTVNGSSTEGSAKEVQQVVFAVREVVCLDGTKVAFYVPLRYAERLARGAVHRGDSPAAG